MMAELSAFAQPITTRWAELGKRFSVLVSHFDEPNGLHGVVTMRQGVREKVAVERFETVLAAGQSAQFPFRTLQTRRPSGSC
jgi:hypothetical protein